jgi:hypothetical protein
MDRAKNVHAAMISGASRGCRCRALGGLEALVTEEMLYLVERDSLLNQP